MTIPLSAFGLHVDGGSPRSPTCVPKARPRAAISAGARGFSRYRVGYPRRRAAGEREGRHSAFGEASSAAAPS